MTIVYLVRHGETDWNRQRKLQGRKDIALNETGITQAGQLAEIFARLGITAVASSNLSRARETARIIAAACGLHSVEEHPGLTERDFGSAEGMTYEARSATFPGNIVPDSESDEAVYVRAIRSLREIATSNPDAASVVVSHGSAINVLLRHITGGSHGPGITILKNGSVTKLFYENGKFEPVYVNIDASELLEKHSAG